jgi:hypothetical protein
VPLLLSGGAFHGTATVTSFPCSKVAGGWGREPPLLPSPAGLCIYSSREGVPLPTFRSSGHHTLFATDFFFSSCLLIIQFFFFLFSLVGGQSVQRAMLICPREYRVPLICSPGGLRLPSTLGAGVWQCRSPPGFSV